MENMENLEVVQTSENVEQTTEQTPVKTYSQEEVDQIVGKRLARQQDKLRKEYDREYGDLVSVLEAGTGKKGVGELKDTFKQFYSQKGIRIPEKPLYSEQDINILAKAEAQEFINAGYDDVVEEVERLTSLGAERMSPREKAVFRVLAEHRQSAERGQELSRIGVAKDIYESQDFKDFAGKFNPNTPVKDIYDIYAKTQPKKNIRTMGSMKNNDSADSGVKDFYTVEEARRFTKADFDKNPALFAAVEKSMQKW